MTFRYKREGINTTIQDGTSGQYFLFQKFGEKAFSVHKKKDHALEEEYFLKGDFQFYVKTRKMKSFGFWLNSDFSVREAG